MTLQEFLTDSLVQIMEGLKDAQNRLEKSHARICPTLSAAISPHGQETFLGMSRQGRPVSTIDYDIAIVISKEGGGKIEVAAPIIGSAGAGAVKSQEYSSRLKFSVPVIYPDIDK